MLKKYERYENGVLVEERQIEVAAAVPASVTPLQARKAIRAAGMKAAVDAWLASQTEEVREAWEFTIEVRRDSPLIAAAQSALNLTNAQMDGLFIQAATL